VKGVWQELLLDPKVLAAVPAPPDSTQPSRPKRLSEFVSRLHQRFGYVLRISSLGFVSDTVSFVMQGNPVLLVVDVQDICRWVSRQSTRNPEAVRAKVIGTTMVNVRLSKVEYC
jgi:hypothetical protein